MTQHIKEKVGGGLCKNKKHTFIVTCWKISQNKHQATEFMCQNCGVLIEKANIESINHQINQQIRTVCEKSKDSHGL